MGIAWILLEIGLNGFDTAYVMSLSTDRKSHKSWVQRKHIIAFWAVLVSVFCAINFLTNFSLLSVFLFPALWLLYPVLFNKINVIKQMLYVLFSITIIFCVEFLVILILMNVYYQSLAEILSNPDTRLQVIIFGKTVIALTWIYFFKKNQRKNTPQDLFRTYIIVVFISALFFSLIPMFGQVLVIEGYYKVTIPFMLLFVFMSILLFLKYMIQKQQLDHQLLEIDYKEKIVKSYQASSDFYNKVIEDQRKIWKTMLEIRDGDANASMKTSQAMRLANERLNRQRCTGNSLVDAVIMIKDYEFSMQEIVLKVEGELTTAYIPEVSMIVDNLLSKAFDETQSAHKNDYMFPFIVTLKFAHFNDEKSLVMEIEYPSQSITPLPLDQEIKNVVEQLEGIITANGWRSDSESDYQATRIQLNRCQKDVK